MLDCMKAQKRSFYAGEEVYSFDTPRKIVGILLNGQAAVIRYEYNGTRSILENLSPKSIFGEHLSLSLIHIYPEGRTYPRFLGTDAGCTPAGHL